MTKHNVYESCIHDSEVRPKKLHRASIQRVILWSHRNHFIQPILSSTLHASSQCPFLYAAIDPPIYAATIAEFSAV